MCEDPGYYYQAEINGGVKRLPTEYVIVDLTSQQPAAEQIEQGQAIQPELLTEQR